MLAVSAWSFLGGLVLLWLMLVAGWVVRQHLRGAPLFGHGEREGLERQDSRLDDQGDLHPQHWWQRTTPVWLWLGLILCGLSFFLGAPDGMSWGNWAYAVIAAAVIAVVVSRWHRQVVLTRLGKGSAVVWVRWGRAARDDSQLAPQVVVRETASDEPGRATPETEPPAARSHAEKVDELHAKQLITHEEHQRLRDPVWAAESSEPDRKTCPDCAESVLAAARVCRYCGYRFDDA